LTSDLKWLLI